MAPRYLSFLSSLIRRKPSTSESPTPCSSQVLHVGLLDPYVKAVLVTAEFVGVNVSVVHDLGVDLLAKYPEYANLKSLIKMPMMETQDGFIFSSAAIAKFLVSSYENHSLCVSSPFHMALVDQWIDFASSDVYGNIEGWSPYAYPTPDDEVAIIMLKKALEHLNIYLASRKYLVGEGVSVADIFMICSLQSGFTSLLDKSFTSEFPNVERYFWDLVQQEKFKKVLGEVTQTVSDDKVKAPTQLKRKRFREASAEIDLNTTCDAPSVGKRVCSVTSTTARNEAVEGFWNFYYSGKHSLWFFELKESEDIFASLDEFVKKIDMDMVPFGKVLVLKSSEFKIKGFVMFRGRFIPQNLLDDAYIWSSVDVNDPTKKETINNMIMAEQTFDGVPLMYDIRFA